MRAKNQQEHRSLKTYRIKWSSVESCLCSNPIDFFEMHEHFKTDERHFSPFYLLPIRVMTANHIDCFKPKLKLCYSFLESLDESFEAVSNPLKEIKSLKNGNSSIHQRTWNHGKQC
jgi:histidinol phosphatase-like enzyme